jgi:HAT1-interacting factor 1
LNAALGQDNPLTGLLGKTFGESSVELEEAKKNAKDLSGLVRKRAKEEPKPEKSEETNGKRKAEEPAGSQEDTKKARVEEAAAQS